MLILVLLCDIAARADELLNLKINDIGLEAKYIVLKYNNINKKNNTTYI